MRPHFRSPFGRILAATTTVFISVTSAQAASTSWNGAGSAWLTTTNWTPNGFPGSASTTTNTDIATFAVAGQPTVGINMNTNGGVFYVGAIDYTNSTARNIGDSSATPGVLTLNGATVNSAADTIIRNSSTGLLTIQAAQSGAMGLALGDATSNIVQITSTGGITISSNITEPAAGRKLTLQGGGTGKLTLAGTNTYTGATTISTGILQFAKAVSLYNNTNASWTAANISVASGATFAINVGGTGEFSTGNVTTLLGNLDGAVNNDGLQSGSFIGFDTTTATGSTFTVADTIADTTGTGGGAVGVAKLGTNTLVLTGPNTYTGGTNLSAGILSFTPGGLGSTGAVTFTGNSTLQYGASTNTDLSSRLVITNTFTGTIDTNGNDVAFATGFGASGTGSLTKAGAGTLTLSGANTYTGTTTIGAGTLALSGGSNRLATTGAVTFTGTSTLDIGSTSQTITTLTAPTATSTATVTGTGILTATNINVVSAATAISTLQLGAGGSSLTVNATSMLIAQQGSGAVGGATNTGIVTFIGNTTATIGTLTLGNNTRVNSATTGTGNASGSLTMGAGALNAPTMIIGQDTAGGNYTNASTTAGTFTTGSGTVKVSTLTMGDKRSSLGNMTVNSTFNLNNGGILQAGTIANGANANTRVTRDFNWNDGTIQNYDSGTNLTLSSATTGATALKVKLASTGTHTFDISSGRTATVSTALIDATSGGTLVKAGPGTLTLSATNTYTGNTAVNGGILLLTGSVAGPASVGTTGTLAGNGTVAGATTFATTGILSPGNSDVNTLNFGSTLTFDSGSTYAVTITAAATNDKVIATGALTANGSIAVTLSGYTPVAGNSFDLADASSITGTPTFDFTAATLGAGLAWNTSSFATNGTIAVVATGTTYTSWINGFTFAPGADKTPTGDPDADGIDNGAEIVLGGDPATGMDSALQPTIELVNTDLGAGATDYLLFTYRRSDLSVSAGVTASCETGSDLIGWTPAVDGVAGVIVLTDDNYASFVPPAANTDRVRVYVPRGANTTLFGRLHVVVP